MTIAIAVILFALLGAWVGNRIADEWYKQLERGYE